MSIQVIIIAGLIFIFVILSLLGFLDMCLIKFLCKDKYENIDKRIDIGVLFLQGIIILLTFIVFDENYLRLIVNISTFLLIFVISSTVLNRKLNKCLLVRFIITSLILILFFFINYNLYT